MTATETTAIDVWGWTNQKPEDLDLGQMLALKREILADKEAFRALENHLSDFESEPKGEAAVQAGLARWLLGDLPRALPLLEAGQPASGVAAYALAEALTFGGALSFDAPKGQPTRAAEILSHLKDAPEALTLRLHALIKAGDVEAAEKALESAPKSYQESSDGRFFRTRLIEIGGDHEGAIAGYEAILADDPDHVEARFHLALALDYINDDDRAIEFYEDLVDRVPPPVNALMNLGVLYEDHERYRDAVFCYRKVLSIYPQHLRARLYIKDAEASLTMYYDEEQQVQQDKKNQILKIPVSDFELSVRSRNCLSKMNIVTLGDLVNKTETELLSYKNFGDTSLNEIRQILESKGLRLGMKPEDELLPVQPAGGPVAEPQRRPTPPSFAVDPSDERLKNSVNDLNLSVRARKCLSNLGINTIGDLVAYTVDDLLSQRNFGATSLKEITDQLAEMGLSLRTVDK